MKAKKLIILMVAAVVLVVVAVLMQDRRGSGPKANRTGEKVMPELAVNDVRSIRIAGPAETTTVKRVSGQWVSDDMYGYRADFEKIRQTLLDLADLKVGQVLSLTAEQKARLHVTPPSSATNAGTRVTLYGKDDQELSSLLLGNEYVREATGPAARYGSYPDGRYVSPDGGDSVYLVADTLSGIATAPKNWLDDEIVNVAPADVSKVRVVGTNGSELVFNKQGEDMVIEGLGEDEEMDSSQNYNIKSGLSYLRFDSVADPSLTPARTGLDEPAVYEVHTATGEVYTARIGSRPEGGSGRYLKMSVGLKPAAPAEETGAEDAKAEAADADEDEANQRTNEVASADDSAGEDAAAAEAKAAARKQLEDKVAELQARFEKWTYVISDYEADSMLLDRSKVVKPKEEEQEDEAAAADEAADDAGEEAADDAAGADEE